jgi:hypothetical protein
VMANGVRIMLATGAISRMTARGNF